jgi:hypothetical protein
MTTDAPIQPATWASFIVTFSLVTVGWHSHDDFIAGAASGFLGHWLMRWVDARRIKA